METRVRRGTCVALGVLLACTCAARSAYAAPKVDQDSGTWTDSFQDNVGIAGGADTYGLKQVFTGGYVTLDDPEDVGQLSTITITPSSTDEWRRVYLDFTAAAPSDVEVFFKGASGAFYPNDPDAGSGYPILPSDRAGWTGRVDLAGTSDLVGVPGDEASGRLIVRMKAHVLIRGAPDGDEPRPVDDPDDVRVRPTLQAVMVTWHPISLVRLQMEGPGTIPSGQDMFIVVRVSVSLVSARDLVVHVPLVTPEPDEFGREYPLIFSGAESGGQLRTAESSEHGVPIPARSVVWRLGDRNAGSTFRLVYKVRTPPGTLNGTSYEALASAVAANAAPLSASASVTSHVTSAPGPSIRVESDGLLIKDRYYVTASDELTYRIFVSNFPSPPQAGTEAYHRTVVYDDVSDLVAPQEEGWSDGSVFTGTPPAAFTISDFGEFTDSEIEVDGVTVPANSIYWSLGTLEPGARKMLQVSLTLKADGDNGGPLTAGHLIASSARIASGYSPQSATASSEVYIGLPANPEGNWALGDLIRGSGVVTGGAEDNNQKLINFGDAVTYLLLWRNTAVSTLDDAVMIDKIPDGTTFSSALLDASGPGTIYYHTGGAENAPDDPPDYDLATGIFDEQAWLTSPPDDPATVTWVGFKVDKIASRYFPIEGLDDQANGQVTVTVDPPSGPCSRFSVEDHGLLWFYGYTPQGGSPIGYTPAGGMIHDVEHTTVRPVTPNISNMQVYASTSTMAASGDVRFSVTINNAQQDGADTDTARDVEVVLALPKTWINGVYGPLPFVSLDAGGGSVDYTRFPDEIVVRYGAIAPFGVRSIGLTTYLPPGFFAGTTFGLSARATAQDDVCGQVSGFAYRYVTATAQPYLQIAGESDLAVAQSGSTITYTLAYDSIGDAVSRDTWIVVHIPPGTTFAWAEVPEGGEVSFYDGGSPSVPESLRDPDFPFSLGLLSNFSFGEVIDDVLLPPALGGEFTWIAFHVDDTTLPSAILPVGGHRSFAWAVTLADELEQGTSIQSEAAILSRELLPAISNEVAVLVSPDPSLDATRTCPEVVSVGEQFPYAVDYVNNSTNDDYAVQLIEQLPPTLEPPSGVHRWNEAAQAHTEEVTPTWDEEASTFTFDVGALVSPLISLEGGEAEVTSAVVEGTPSGTFIEIGGLATATDGNGEALAALFTDCRVLVENADLFVRLGVDQAAPLPGEELTYTVFLSNEGFHDAKNVSLVVTLPSGIEYVPERTLLTTNAWGFMNADPEPALDDRTLTWSVATGNALTRDGLDDGLFPGRSGDVVLSFKAHVSPDMPQGETLTTGVVAATDTGEDLVHANEDAIDVRTPRPDLAIAKTGPAVAPPGATVTYRLAYENITRQGTGDVVVIDRVFDGPSPDGNPDMTYLRHTATNGEEVWFHGNSLLEVTPDFVPGEEVGHGWRRDPFVEQVNFIAFHRSGLTGNAGPHAVFVTFALRDSGGLTPQPGTLLTNQASISQVGEGSTEEEDLANNDSNATTATPMVDVAVTATCDPVGGHPGAVPGETVSLTLELANLGTVPAYGLRLDHPLPDWFERLGDDALLVEVTDARGGTRNLVDEQEALIPEPVAWTHEVDEANGLSLVLGSLDESDPRWFRKVALPARSFTRITLSGVVRGDVLDGTEVDHDANATIAYRYDFNPDEDPAEEITDNNHAGCGTTIYRPDPMVRKSAPEAETLLRNGARVRYELAYNNVGGAAAEGVVLEDVVPDNAFYVIGSEDGIPPGAHVALDDGNGTFDHETTLSAGEVDPDVRAMRVIWDEPLPAPAGKTFIQDGDEDFATGDFSDNAQPLAGRGRVAVGSSGETVGRYLSPAFPNGEEGRVIAWDRIVVEARVDEGTTFTVAVLDGESGEELITGLVPDESGAIDLDIDASSHPTLYLRADMQGLDFSCDYTRDWLQPVEGAPVADIWNGALGCNAQGDIFGNGRDAYDQDAASFWRRAGDDWTVERLPRGAYRYERVWADFGVDRLIGLASIQGPIRYRVVEWHYVGGAWTVAELPGQPPSYGFEFRRLDQEQGLIIATMGDNFATHKVWKLVADSWTETPLTFASPGSWVSWPFLSEDGYLAGAAADTSNFQSVPAIWHLEGSSWSGEALPEDDPDVTEVGVHAINADATIILGQGRRNNAYVAVVWTRQGSSWTFAALPDPPAGATNPTPYVIAHDGSIFGTGGANNIAMVRWRFDAGWSAETVPLPAGYTFPRHYLLMSDARTWIVRLSDPSFFAQPYALNIADDGTVAWEELPLPASPLDLISVQASAGDTVHGNYGKFNQGNNLVSWTRVAGGGWELKEYGSPNGHAVAQESLASPWAPERCGLVVGRTLEGAALWDPANAVDGVVPYRTLSTAQVPSQKAELTDATGEVLIGESYAFQLKYPTVWRLKSDGLQGYQIYSPAQRPMLPGIGGVAAGGDEILATDNFPTAFVWRFDADRDEYMPEPLTLGIEGMVHSVVYGAPENGIWYTGAVSDGISTQTLGGWVRSEAGNYLWVGNYLPAGFGVDSFIAASESAVIIKMVSGAPATRYVVVLQDATAEDGVRGVVLADENGTASGISASDIGYANVVAGQSAGRPTIWVPAPDGAFVPQLPSGVDEVMAVSDVPWHDTGYPLVAGRSGGDNRLFAPDLAGAYTPLDVPVPDGFDSVALYNDRWHKNVEAGAEVNSGFRFGIIGGVANGPDGTATFMWAPNDQGALVPIPIGGFDPEDTTEVDFVGAGPVLYGRIRGERHNFDEAPVGWWFPEGDLTQPTPVDGLPAGATRGLWGMNAASKPFGSTDAVTYVVAETCSEGPCERESVFLVPHDEGIAVVQSTLPAALAACPAEPAPVHVEPDAQLIRTRKLTCQQSFDIPGVWGCGKGGGVELARWEVIYRTDVDPIFSYELEVQDVCATALVNSASIATTSPQISEANDTSSVSLPIETTDLALTLRADNAVVETGGVINYTVVIENRGHNAAADVVIELTHPNEYLDDYYVIVAPLEGPLPPGASAEIGSSLEVLSDAAAAPIVASASVVTTTIDCNDANDQASTTGYVGSFPNARVVRVDAPAKVAPDSPYTVWVTAENNGNAAADAVVLIVPPAAELVGLNVASPAPEACFENGEGNVECQVDPMDPGSESLVVGLELKSGPCETIGEVHGHRAEIGSAFDLLGADNNGYAETKVVEPGGFAELMAFFGRSTVELGDEVNMFVIFRNAGGEGLTSAFIESEIPFGTVLIPESLTEGATYNENSVFFETGTHLSPGSGGMLMYTVQVVDPSYTELVAGVAMTPGEGSPACPQSVPFDSVAVIEPGLHVLKEASTHVACGDSIDWRITLTNTGETTLSGLVVSDELPAASPYVAGSIHGPVTAASAASAPLLVWTLGDLAPGGVVRLGYQSLAPPSSGQLVTNVAKVEIDGALVATSAKTPIRAECASPARSPRTGPLELAKTWSASCSGPGDDVLITLTATNTERYAIGDVVVTDRLPPGLEFRDSPDGSWDGDARNFSAWIGVLVPGERRTVSLRARIGDDVADGTLLVDAARVVAPGFLPTASNQVVAAVTCGDGNACTRDLCTPDGGCAHEPLFDTDLGEVCDGVDNDCDEVVDADDDDFVPTLCEVQAGVCEGSTGPGCVEGTPVPCGADDYESASGGVYDTVDASCDGVDDDCDGSADEEYDQPGSICVDGGVQCEPTGPEQCDGLDNECDGYVDDGFDVGEPCAIGLGACFSQGTIVCDGNGGEACDAEVIAPGAERCNDALDGDCDGDPDNGFEAVGAPCDADDANGASVLSDTDRCANDLTICNAADTTRTACQPVVFAFERCNGIDDDCDGVTDELWPTLRQPCDGTNDADKCARGKIECNLDFNDVYCHEVDLGVSELCNGKDDTCDAAIDEGFDLGGLCMTDGLGACRVTGRLACDASDGQSTVCVASAQVSPSAEACNGRDDDCDGATDELPLCAPPETDILTGPQAITGQHSASFTYVNPLAASHTTFECRLDGGAWARCDHVGASPSLDYDDLAEGQHVLLVRAVRGDGAVDATPDFWIWTIDGAVPDTLILSAPSDPSQNPNGTFVFGATIADPAGYRCVLDPAVAAGVCPAVGSPAYKVCPEHYGYSGLADGSHALCVYVTDGAGVADPFPARHAWLIDTTAPETEIGLPRPPAVSAATSATFHYLDPTAPATDTFECRLDGAAWRDCDGKTHAYADLAEGEHTFEVRTIDPDGLADPTPATYTWVVDRTAPCPTITAHPTDPAQSGAATFELGASEPGVTWYCLLDPAPADLGPDGEPLTSAYSACGAAPTFDGLADGSHTLWVYALDAAGNLGTCRAHFTWRIDTRAPETEITAGPTPLTGSGEVAAFAYHDPTDPDLDTFECSLDGATFTPCDGGATEYDGLGVGPHTLLVRSCDSDAEVPCDPTPAAWAWEVTPSPCPNDRRPPTLECADDLELECVAGGATVDLDALAPAATDACVPVVTTTSAGAAVGLGQTPIVFTSVDGNGNVASCVVIVSVVDRAAPLITCPADVSATTDDGLCTTALAPGPASASDACQGSAAILLVDDAPPLFMPGETLVTHHALDAFGNDATCVQAVTVADDEPLVLSCSDSVTVDAAPDACAWSGTQSALATDNCSEELEVDVQGSYPIGTSPIHFAAEDAAGNSAACTTDITVRDVTAPVVGCGAAADGVTPALLRAAATDACDAVVTIENVVCASGTSPLLLADCPLTVAGDSIEVARGLSDAELLVTYDARAVDPSGNAAVVPCRAAFERDAGAEVRFVASGSGGCSGGAGLVGSGLVACVLLVFLVLVARMRRRF